MRNTKSIITSLLLLIAIPAFAGTARINFHNELPGAEAREFSSLVGYWHIDSDAGRSVYAVDGRNREQGLFAAKANEKAKNLYGDSYRQFLKNLAAYRYFPLSVCSICGEFRSGTIEVSFKPISGKIDQGAGIAFDIKRDGEYMVLRVNALENNMVLFKMEGGRRSTVQWVRNVPTPSNRWQTLKLVVTGKRLAGYLDGKKYLEFNLPSEVEGNVGLWSKADSYVLFDHFWVEPRWP